MSKKLRLSLYTPKKVKVLIYDTTYYYAINSLML